MHKIKTIIQKGKAWTQDELIRTLNAVIRGWTNYHRHTVASEDIPETGQLHVDHSLEMG